MSVQRQEGFSNPDELLTRQARNLLIEGRVLSDQQSRHVNATHSSDGYQIVASSSYFSVLPSPTSDRDTESVKVSVTVPSPGQIAFEGDKLESVVLVMRAHSRY